MRRREFIAGVVSAAAWPVLAGAQQAAVRRIGFLSGFAESDPDQQLIRPAFEQDLAKLGWTEGRNLRIEYRWGAGDIDRIRIAASELVELRPDMLLASGTPALAAVQTATRAIPIVFTLVGDPVGGGFVASLARPGGNITGFIPIEPPLAGKWLELPACQVNPFKPGQFARASGVLAKNDPLDARMIASFVAIMPTRPAQPCPLQSNGWPRCWRFAVSSMPR